MRARRLVSIAFALATAAVTPAAGQSTITWLTMDFPPFFIHQGNAAGEGIADGVMALLEGELGSYRHRREMAEPAEIVRRLKAGDPVCSAAYIKTPERERFLLFSTPDLVLPPNGVTVRRRDLDRFGGTGAVSLEKLLDNRELKGAVAVGRSYGTAIDDLLAAHKSSPHLYWRRGDDIYRSLFELLLKGSVDYVVGYPYEARYFAATADSEADAVTLPITENRDYTIAHVVCPRSEWGEQAIARIDTALRQHQGTEAHRALVERWLGPEQIEEYRRQYAAVMTPPER